jgi:hypothetical protein
MKSWLTKLRISAALDAGCKLSGALRRRIDSSEELLGAEEEMRALDRTLKQARPEREAPPGLHRSIMQAVRAAERPQAAPSGLAWLRWLAAPVVATVVLVVIWEAQRGPVVPPTQGPQSLAAATTALEISGQLAQRVPSAVVAPLSDELTRVNQDLDNTAQFILASLP